MAVTRVSQSTVKEGLEKANSFLGGFVPPGMVYDSIATVTVGAGGSATMDFSSIPQTYQHLQIRMISRDTRNASSPNNANFRFNGDTGANYAWHYLLGDGAAASAGAVTSTTSVSLGLSTSLNMTATVFGAAFIDILDYTSTSKYKVCRSQPGVDSNGAGQGRFESALWMSTSAITSITIFAETSASFAQYSTAALYGIKAPAV